MADPPMPDRLRECLLELEDAALELRKLTRANQECEMRFGALVQASSQVVFHMSPDWSVLQQLVGRNFVADTEAPEPRWLDKYIPSRDQARVMETVEHAIRTRSVVELEHPVLRADGSRAWALSRAVPVIDASGALTEWFGMASDVTARKAAETQLAERTAEVQRSASQLAQLAEELTLVEFRERRRMAEYLHDHLQQLLYAAIMMAKSLSADSLSRSAALLASLRQTLAEAFDAARDVSKDLAPPVSVYRHLSEAMRWLQRDKQRRQGLKVSVRVEGVLDDVPEPESIFLFTAARELLNNVAKHAGPCQVELRLRRRGRLVILDVTDDGLGYDMAGPRAAETNGFGLFNIRERAELLGGRMTMRSVQGDGTHARVRIPIPAAAPSRTAGEPQADRPVTGRKRS